MRERKEINVLLGERIRIAREKAGLTQEQFGALVSLGSKNVSDIERGLVGISISTLKRICEKLPVSSDQLLFGERESSEAAYLTERLKLLPKEQFAAVESFLNQTFRMFGMLEK